MKWWEEIELGRGWEERLNKRVEERIKERTTSLASALMVFVGLHALAETHEVTQADWDAACEYALTVLGIGEGEPG